MGCFLGCFGFSKKRKRRRKPSNKVVAGYQRCGRYELLDSSITVIRSSREEKFQNADFEPRAKVRKKVSFNMNLQIYEPISTSYHSLEEEEEMKNKDEEKEKERSLSTSRSKKNFPAFRMGSFHSHYRYQHCRECYDEEDILAFNERELEDDIKNIDDDDDDDDYDDEYDGNNIGHNDEHYADDYESEFPIAIAQGINQGISDSKQLGSVSKSSHMRVSKEPHEGKSNFTIPSCVSTKEDNLCRNATNEGQNTYSVLNPVENLTQWREVKTKVAAYKHQQEENNIAFVKTSRPSSNPSPFSLVTPCYNQSKCPLQGIAIDASLSSWLNSPSNPSGQKSIISNSSIAVRTM